MWENIDVILSIILLWTCVSVVDGNGVEWKFNRGRPPGGPSHALSSIPSVVPIFG